MTGRVCGIGGPELYTVAVKLDHLPGKVVTSCCDSVCPHQPFQGLVNVAILRELCTQTKFAELEQMLDLRVGQQVQEFPLHFTWMGKAGA